MAARLRGLDGEAFAAELATVPARAEATGAAPLFIASVAVGSTVPKQQALRAGWRAWQEAMRRLRE